MAAMSEFSGRTVLVTGGTGFLGSALVKRLHAEGAAVRVLARSPQKAQKIADYCAQITEGDLCDPVAVAQAMTGCEFVFHVAAATTGNLARQQEANVTGTRTVMNAAANAHVQRVVHVSSISVYGNNYPGDVTEDMRPTPGADPYARTKLEAETIVRDAGSHRGTSYSIIRPGMIYGPRSSLWTGQLFQLAKRNPLPFPGDGSGHTHPIFVEDVVDLMMLQAVHPAAEHQTFNCSADPAPTWREFLQGYSRLSGHQNWLALPLLPFHVFAGLALLAAPRDSIVRDLPDLLRLLLSHTTYKTTKARELLGWSPHVSLEDGIARCEPWLREKGLLR